MPSVEARMRTLLEAADPLNTELKRKLNRWMKDAEVYLKRITNLPWEASKYEDRLFGKQTVTLRVKIDGQGQQPRFEVQFDKPKSDGGEPTVNVRVQSDEYNRDRASFHKYYEKLPMYAAVSDPKMVLDPLKIEIARFVDPQDKSAEYDELLSLAQRMVADSEKDAAEAAEDAVNAASIVRVLKETPGRLPPGLEAKLEPLLKTLNRRGGDFAQAMRRYMGIERSRFAPWS